MSLLTLLILSPRFTLCVVRPYRLRMPATRTGTAYIYFFFFQENIPNQGVRDSRQQVVPLSHPVECHPWCFWIVAVEVDRWFFLFSLPFFCRRHVLYCSLSHPDYTVLSMVCSEIFSWITVSNVFNQFWRTSTAWMWKFMSSSQLKVNDLFPLDFCEMCRPATFAVNTSPLATARLT